jgi:hypothetical protein
MNVGGHTVAEAKERMSYAEAVSWAAYMRKRGPVNVLKRLDHGFAMIATMINRFGGGKAEPIDFLPYADRPETSDGDAASAEDVLAFFRSKQK